MYSYHGGSHWSDFTETMSLGALREDRSVFRIVSTDMCTATIQKAHCCASMATLSVFIALLTATCLCQLHKGNVLLCCHGNYGYANTSQCHVIRTHITSRVISLIHRVGFHCIALFHCVCYDTPVCWNIGTLRFISEFVMLSI